MSIVKHDNSSGRELGVVFATLSIALLLSSCSSSSSNGENLSPEKEAQLDEKEDQPKLKRTNQGAAVWTLKIGEHVYELTNVGKSECFGSDCKYYDYTRIVEGASVRYFYQDMAADRSGVNPIDYKYRKTPAAGELTADPGPWITHAEPTLAKLSQRGLVRSWSNETSLEVLRRNAEEARAEILDRCKSHPVYRELKESPINSFGNYILKSSYFFWINRNLSELSSAVEVDSVTGSIIGVTASTDQIYLTDIPDDRGFAAESEKHFFQVTMVGMPSISGEKPIDLNKARNFSLACSKVYNDLWGILDGRFIERIDPKASTQIDQNLNLDQLSLFADYRLHDLAEDLVSNDNSKERKSK